MAWPLAKGLAEWIASCAALPQSWQRSVLYWALETAAEGRNRARKSYIGYNITYSNGFGEGNGSGIKGGGFSPPSFGGFVERNISYSNSGPGLNNNTGDKVTFKNNTTWNNKASIKTDPDTTVMNTLSPETRRFGTPGIETNNSWQRSGTVRFKSTDPASPDFLVPTVGGGFEDIGAHAVGN